MCWFEVVEFVDDEEYVVMLCEFMVCMCVLMYVVVFLFKRVVFVVAEAREEISEAYVIVEEVVEVYCLYFV